MDFFNSVNRSFNAILFVVGGFLLGIGLFLAGKMGWDFDAYSTSLAAAGAALAVNCLAFVTFGHKDVSFLLAYMLYMLFLIVVDAAGAGAVLYNEQEIMEEVNRDLNQTDISFRLTSQDVRLMGWGIFILVAVEVVAVLLAWSQRQHLMEILSEKVIVDLRQKLLEAPDPQAFWSINLKT